MANDRLIFRCICGETKGVAKYYPECELDIASSHWMAALDWMNEHLAHWPGVRDQGSGELVSMDLGDTMGVEFGTEALLAEGYPHHWTLTSMCFPEIGEWCWIYFGNIEPDVARWNGTYWWGEAGRYDTSRVKAWKGIGPMPTVPTNDMLYSQVDVQTSHDPVCRLVL